MKLISLVKAVSLALLSTSAMALPSADTSQANHCRGIVASTKVTSAGSYYLVGTYLYLEVGPIGQKYWVDFVDDDNVYSTYYREPQDAYSQAGCENCLLDNEYRYNRQAISEHFWQDEEYSNFKDYCASSYTFGIWLPGEYCQMLTQQHGGCTPL